MSEPSGRESCGSLRIEKRVEEIVGQLSEASIAVDGLFCDLDAGFDGKNSEVP